MVHAKQRRYPISATDTDDDFWLGLVTAKVCIPGARAEATVVVTHLSAPWPEPIAGWRADLARMAEKLPQLANGDGDGGYQTSLFGVLAIGKHPIPSEAIRPTVRRMEAGPGPPYYLAEWYLPELTDRSVDDFVAKIDVAATTISDEGSPVRLLVTLAVPTDEVLYGVFAAQSPDTVTTTCQRAGLPHQRLSSHVGTRIRKGPHAAMFDDERTRISADAEPTPL